MGFLDIFKASENKQLRESLAMQTQLLNQRTKDLMQKTEALEQLQKQYAALDASMPREKKDFDALARKAAKLQRDVEQMTTIQADLTEQNRQLDTAISTKSAELAKTTTELQKVSRLYEQFKAAVKGYEKNPNSHLATVFVDDELMPFATTNLNCLNVKELRARFRNNQKERQRLYKRYLDRFTTQFNIAIYKLLTIAMEAELQSILGTLSYGKVDTAIQSVEAMIKRYYEITVENNSSMAAVTMSGFIAEAKLLFVDAVSIEYEYYVKKEQAREEQRALKEQMRQEAEERKALEAEKKKVEKEEAKYITEIRQLDAKLSETTDETKLAALQERIAQLEAQMLQVQQKKEQIINLQNGKAGYVYVISNLGSFGSDVFKIGMTRRSEPMDRVKELGDASVPFSFDVHSFIFSQDAVALENALHKQLHQQRVNKVNLRKEFFRISLDELEQIVLQHDPSAEFKRTMAAEQYYQSLNRDEVVAELDYTITDDE
ncbi:MAG: GIY-YIG nuclease family protein [Oscillospiraceae bacterium]|nr:GIY-YIG nuclease family protein [Oscillospiraceae bacterium]